MQTYKHAHIHTWTYTYKHACMHACMHEYIHAYMHAYIHTDIYYMFTHTNTKYRPWYDEDLAPEFLDEENLSMVLHEDYKEMLLKIQKGELGM
jgi:hypothetical protein